jgi:bifunctional lysine-specific demethylase and histidyl-hydroxylase NO66
VTRTAAPALVRCVGDPDAFVRDVWGRRARAYRRTDRPATAGDGFDDLLTLRDVDHLLSETALRTPAFRVFKDGVALPAARLTRSGAISGVPMTGLADAPRIFAAFDEGATIVLQGLHRYWAPVARLCRDLELTLGHPCQANAYVTPPGSAGLSLHHDAHDVFVLQAFGRKHWDVHPSPAESEGGAREVLLAAGECLYMPKGTPHAASTQHEVSGHLTIGILSTTWRSVLDDAVDDLAMQARLDDALPAGYHRDRDGFRAAVRARLDELARLLDKADAAEVAERTVDRFLTSRAPLVHGGLVDALAARELRDDTALRRRPESVCQLRRRGSTLRVLLGDRELRMPAWLEPAMRRIAAVAPQGTVRASDLGAELDEASRLVLLRRLVREGMLEMTPTGPAGP